MKCALCASALLLLAACGSANDIAPYEAVSDADAPTVRSLEESGYVRADFYPVGCEIPDQPDAACDATGAVFMDRSEDPRDDYSEYEIVCPSIDGVELAEWKCRKQEVDNG